jgi:hypothetical protein
MHNHRLAVDFSERLIGQPGGAQTGWNKDDRIGHEFLFYYQIVRRILAGRPQFHSAGPSSGQQPPQAKRQKVSVRGPLYSVAKTAAKRVINARVR